MASILPFNIYVNDRFADNFLERSNMTRLDKTFLGLSKLLRV